MREHTSTDAFHKFKRQLFHSLLTRILSPLHPAMKVPELVLFGDDYYRRVIYALAAYIADYEEQVLLSCILHNWCAKCIAHRENLDEEALHRCREHSDVLIKEFEFRKLQEEYGITGDLVVSTYSLAFLLVTNRIQLLNVIMETMLDEIDDALQCFHHYREVFRNFNVINSFSLPQQHSMMHYNYLICQFGAEKIRKGLGGCSLR